MSNYIATLYSHEANFDFITIEAKELFPKADWDYDRKNEFTIATLNLKSGFLQSKKKLIITYRERNELGFELTEAKCAVTTNLSGMTNLIQSISTPKENIKALLIKKISTINSEFSIEMISNAEKEFKALVTHLAIKSKAIVFAQPRTGLMNSLHQGWLDSNLQLILDMEGNSNVEDLEVNIATRYFDNQAKALPEQINRKNNSELILRKYGIIVNEKLPAITTINETNFRSAKEIAERVVSLALTNLVAFSNITGEQALQFANKHEIINLLTPKEIEFLKNPTDEAKNHETWKCEAIWTMCWALGIIENLTFPDVMADLSNIPEDLYPIGSKLKPSDFISLNKNRISESVILDMNDLYYRMDWACVDSRLKKEEIKMIHPGIIFERHYALNWLIGYRDQDWDNISTDT